MLPHGVISVLSGQRQGLTAGMDIRARQNPTALDEYYQRAERMLEPVPYPAHSPELPKLKLLEKQAECLGAEYSSRFYRPPIGESLPDSVHPITQVTNLQRSPSRIESTLLV